ncbi:hypothetical protein ADEAN_000112200 [Angomonas deanei]|uniref:Leucine Rich repeat n=1 Tax=Angomonas deanei TaxID=59799 RepID=A0A7G2C1Z7_9TRYP|nr:hypothetical protein ADEAN_000112200 [Angomonas deanei]
MLDLRFCPHLKTIEFPAVLNLANLRILLLEQTPITNLHILLHTPNLQILTIRSCQHLHDFDALFQPPCPLEYLDAGGTTIPVGKSLQQCNRLRFLNLEKCPNFTTEAAHSLLEAGVTFPSLDVVEVDLNEQNPTALLERLFPFLKVAVVNGTRIARK